MRATFTPSAVCGSIKRVEAVPRVTDRLQPVGVGALAAAETKTVRHLREGGIPTEIERPAFPQLVVEQRSRPAGVATEQVEHETLEIRGLGDVHGRARGFIGVRAAPHAIDAGAEELIQHVVLVGRNDQTGYGKSHHARNMTGADVSEIARWNGEVDL